MSKLFIAVAVAALAALFWYKRQRDRAAQRREARRLRHEAQAREWEQATGESVGQSPSPRATDRS
jgi:Flp pilus assembly protein TadB